MGINDEQETEREVLESIFEGDERFKKVADNRFQYFFGEKGDCKSFLLEIVWPEAYPDVSPTINLDLFYNNKLFDEVKECIIEKLREESKNFLGMAATFSLIEYVKENFDCLMEDQSEIVAEEEKQQSSEGSDFDSNKKLLVDTRKKVQMTKAQKRRMWDRTTAANLGEEERGWNWVDVVHHLSQTRDTQSL